MQLGGELGRLEPARRDDDSLVRARAAEHAHERLARVGDVIDDRDAGLRGAVEVGHARDESAGLGVGKPVEAAEIRRAERRRGAGLAPVQTHAGGGRGLAGLMGAQRGAGALAGEAVDEAGHDAIRRRARASAARACASRPSSRASRAAVSASAAAPEAESSWIDIGRMKASVVIPPQARAAPSVGSTWLGPQT